jgi:hypothetical protein
MGKNPTSSPNGPIWPLPRRAGPGVPKALNQKESEKSLFYNSIDKLSLHWRLPRRITALCLPTFTNWRILKADTLCKFIALVSVFIPPLGESSLLEFPVHPVQLTSQIWWNPRGLCGCVLSDGILNVKSVGMKS